MNVLHGGEGDESSGRVNGGRVRVFVGPLSTAKVEATISGKR